MICEHQIIHQMVSPIAEQQNEEEQQQNTLA